MLLVVSLPVIIFITYVLLALDAQVFPEMTIGGLSPLAVFVSFAYTVSLAPYIILTSYMLRAAAVTKWEAGTGPFVVGTGRKLPIDEAGLGDVQEGQHQHDDT